MHRGYEGLFVEVSKDSRMGDDSCDTLTCELERNAPLPEQVSQLELTAPVHHIRRYLR